MPIYPEKIRNKDDIYRKFSKIKGVLITTTRNGRVIDLYKAPITPVSIKGDSAVRELEVCISSTETEDARLLHKIYSLIRSSE